MYQNIAILPDDINQQLSIPITKISKFVRHFGNNFMSAKMTSVLSYDNGYFMRLSPKVVSLIYDLIAPLSALLLTLHLTVFLVMFYSTYVPPVQFGGHRVMPSVSQ